MFVQTQDEKSPTWASEDEMSNLAAKLIKHKESLIMEHGTRFISKKTKAYTFKFMEIYTILIGNNRTRLLVIWHYFQILGRRQSAKAESIILHWKDKCKERLDDRMRDEDISRGFKKPIDSMNLNALTIRVSELVSQQQQASQAFFDCVKMYSNDMISRLIGIGLVTHVITSEAFQLKLSDRRMDYGSSSLVSASHTSTLPRKTPQSWSRRPTSPSSAIRPHKIIGSRFGARSSSCPSSPRHRLIHQPQSKTVSSTSRKRMYKLKIPRQRPTKDDVDILQNAVLRKSTYTDAMNNACSRAHFSMTDCIRSVTNEFTFTKDQESILNLLDGLWDQTLTYCHDVDVNLFINTFHTMESGLRHRFHEVILDCIEYGKTSGLMKDEFCPGIIFGIIGMWMPIFAFGFGFVNQMTQACPKVMIDGFEDPFFQKFIGPMSILADKDFTSFQKQRKRIFGRDDLACFFVAASPQAIENNSYLYFNTIVTMIFMMDKAAFPMYVSNMI